MPAIRIADTYVGIGRGSLKVETGEGSLDAGDAFVEVVGIHPRTREAQVARVEFCALFGGGYHPRTIRALYELARAIQADNEDPECPEKYRRREGGL